MDDTDAPGGGLGQRTPWVDAATTTADTDTPDTDMGDTDMGDTDTAELDAVEAELADVDVALQRLGDGTYGRCEICGRALTDAELDRAPASRFCPEHLPPERT